MDREPPWNRIETHTRKERLENMDDKRRKGDKTERLPWADSVCSHKHTAELHLRGHEVGHWSVQAEKWQSAK